MAGDFCRIGDGLGANPGPVPECGLVRRCRLDGRRSAEPPWRCFAAYDLYPAAAILQEAFSKLPAPDAAGDRTSGSERIPARRLKLPCGGKGCVDRPRPNPYLLLPYADAVCVGLG